MSRVFHCRFEWCSGIVTKPWTIRYSMVPLRSSKESQPNYCNIDDRLPLTMVCVVPVVIAGCWLAGRLQSFIVDLAVRCWTASIWSMLQWVRGPDWRSILQLRSYEGLVCKCFDFHWTTSCVSMDKCTSGVCLFADMTDMFSSSHHIFFWSVDSRCFWQLVPWPITRWLKKLLWTSRQLRVVTNMYLCPLKL